MKGLVDRNPGPVEMEIDDPYRLDGIKLIHVNGQSIEKQSKVLKVKALLSHLRGPTVLAITESWLKEDDMNTTVFNIPGYRLIRFDTPRPRSRSIAIYFPNQLELQSSSSKYDKGSNRVWLEFAYKSHPITVGVIYRRPQAALSFFDILEKEATKHLKLDRMCMLTGDFNVDATPHARDPLLAKLEMALDGLGLMQIIHAPTRIAKYTNRQTGQMRVTKTIIDHVYVNEKFGNLRVYPVNVDAGIADHRAVGLVANIGRMGHDPTHQHTYILSPDLTKVSPYELDWRLSEESWAEVYTSTSTDNMAERFHEVLMRNVLLCAPLGKQYTCGCVGQMREGLQWYSAQLGRLRKDRDEYLSAYNQDRTDEVQEWIYKTARNEYTMKLDEAEKKYYESKYTATVGDPKATWKVNDEILGKQTVGTDRIDVIEDTEGRNITIPSKVANTFNSAFASVGIKSSETAVTDLPENVCPMVNTRFAFSAPSVQMVSKVIRSLKPNKPPGPDGIPTKIYKEQVDNLAPVITWMIGKVVEKGCFPKRWGWSFVTPVYKNKGSRRKTTYYRPISIISVISKIFEKVIAAQLVSYLESSNILHNNQYGFRSKRSTQYAVLHVTEYIRSLLNVPRGKPKPIVSVLLLDLSKAFDCVNHALLIKRLEKTGLNGQSLNLMETYLAKRMQAVKLPTISSLEHIRRPNHEGGFPGHAGSTKSVVSDPLKTVCGVPQGSILGPILFILYINSLNNILGDTNSPIVNYADDSTIITCAHTLSAVIAKTEVNLARVKAHFRDLGLDLNVGKTQYMLFNAPADRDGYTDEETSLHINENDTVENIKRSHTAKLLGVTIDDDLQFKSHIKALISKMRSGLFAIKAVRQKIPLHVAQNLMYTLLYCHHDYCALVWSGLGTAAQMNRMENTHKMAIRAVYRKPRTFASQLTYKAGNTYPLELRRKFLLLKFAHGTMHEDAPPNWTSFISRGGANDTARATIPTTHSTVFHNSLKLQAARLWNCLPRTARQPMGPGSFKTIAQNYVLALHDSEWQTRDRVRR